MRSLFMALVLWCGPDSSAQEPIVLRETAAGAAYSVQARVELAGTLTLPAEPGKAAPPQVGVVGKSSVDYDERVLAPLADGTPRAVRLYRQAEFRRTVAERPHEATLRPAARRMVVLRKGSREVPFSPDGPLTFGEIDLVRTDVFTPALAGLLPGQPVRVGDRWPAALAAVEELTDMDRIDQGGLECQLASVTNEGGRRFATVKFAGTVRGLNEDGPNQQTLDGVYTFDMADQFLDGVTLTGIHLLQDAGGKTTGRVEGRFRLTRRRATAAQELADAALQNVALEPNPANTLLVYEGSVAGVRFVYSRRWRVSTEHGRQVTLDDPRGNGILITVEPPDKVPTAADYQREAQDYVSKQKGRVIRSEPPQHFDSESERFALDIELNGKAVRMEYFVTRKPSGGATVAAMLQSADATAMRPEIGAIVKSLTVGPTVPTGVVPVPAK